ncbi:MAG: nucleoside hydrolase [Promethearchaeota archaeon]
MSNKKIPVILDTDIGFDIDDTWALGLLLKCPELDVKLITTVSHDTHIKARIVAKFLECANRTDIPIGIGPQKNSNKGSLYNWVKNYDLSNYPGIIYKDGIEAISSTIEDSNGFISLIAIGPLGNIAEALKLNSKIIENPCFIGMHGSIFIGYKGRPIPTVEYNVFSDFTACRKVFQAPWKKTITPLDTCGKIVLSGDNYTHIMDCDNLVVNVIKECFEIWAEKTGLRRLINKDHKTSVLFDTVAIYLALSEDLVNIEDLKLEVSETGFTIISNDGNMIRGATSWKDLPAFKKFIVNRLIN